MPVDDAEALAGAIERLAADQSFAEALGKQARETVKTHAPDAALRVWDEALGLTFSGRLPSGHGCEPRSAI